MVEKNNAVPVALQAFFQKHNRVALAFSGGCDSAYLLYAANACGVNVTAYYVQSQFQPEFERRDAENLAKQLKSSMRVLELDVLADEQICMNPANRCYYCKRHIFSAIMEAAAEDGYDIIIDGTNASDDAADRPGMRAIHEMQVLSPLRLCGMRKADVRSLSCKAGLFTWNKPAYACLATRFPAGMRIEKAMLKKVEDAENILSNMGFLDFRVRITERGMRLELQEGQLEMLVERRREVVAALGKDFSEITLNLRLRGERET